MESIKKKWLCGIFISVLAIFAMSHNANASNISLAVSNPVGYNPGQVECAVFGQSITLSTNNTCVWGPNVGGVLQGNGFSWIATHQKFPVLTDYVYEVYVDVGTSNNAELMIPVVWSSFNDKGNFILVDFEKVSNDNNLGSSATYEGYVSTYRFVLRPKGNYNIGIELGYSDRSANMLYLVGDNWPVVIDTRITAITRWKLNGEPSNSDIVNAINQLKQSNEQQVQDERNELEQGQSDLQDAGADSTQDAQQGTASLLSAISQAVGVISSASPTNCKLNGNMGNLNMGQLDLCANPAPVFVQTIGSLILILICVPLAISLFNRFINLFRSFQS